MFSARSLLTALAAALALFAPNVNAVVSKNELHERQIEAAKRWQPALHSARQVVDPAPGVAAIQNITFANPRASGQCHFIPA